MAEDIIVEFTGTVNKKIFGSDDFWVYAMNVDTYKYQNIKTNRYNNVSINGNIGELSYSAEYSITAKEVEDKYGISYNVINIRRNEPKTATEILIFLQEILTKNQAKVLYENYPDIVDRVKENRLDDIDLNKLKGIKQYTFNVIVQKIQENFCLADLVIEFQGYLNLLICKKIYEKYNSIEALKTALRKDPYKCLCGLAGIGFKKADSLLLEIETVSKKNVESGKEPIIVFENDLISSCQRCLSCIIYTLQENENNGHTKMNLAELRQQCLLTVPEAINTFPEAIKDPSITYNKENMEIALTHTYLNELYIAKRIKSALTNGTTNWEFDLTPYKTVNGFELSDEQFGIVKNVCVNPISILNGSAGTGKSFSTQAIIKMLKDNKKTFMLMSPTGKASKVLAEYTKEPAATIHRGLGYKPPNQWSYNADYPLPCDVVIVDEFSMVDIFLFNRLLEAIDFNHTRMLLIGDNAQLPSVQCGNLLHDFMESGLIPTVTLSKVFRYGEGGLMKIATDVRCCKQYLTLNNKDTATKFGNGDYMYIDVPADNIPLNVVALYKKLLSQGYDIHDIQVLTSKNIGKCGTFLLNKCIQKAANPNCQTTTGLSYGKGETEIVYYLNDLVIQTQNNYKAKIVEKLYVPKYSYVPFDNGDALPFDLDDEDENNETKNVTDCDIQYELKYNKYNKDEVETAFVANGETGQIVYITDKYMIIDFDGICVRYDKSELGQISLGYSITIHKSQGSTIKITILCTPSSDVFMLNSNLVYVGLTRMKEKCFHFGNVSAVNKAVSTKANLSRNTFMKDLLLSNRL